MPQHPRLATCPTRPSVAEELRSSELAARLGLEPALAARYDRDPGAVLSQFGLSVAEPVYSGGRVLIEQLGAQWATADSAYTMGCTHGCPEPAAHAAAPVRGAVTA
ncbi:hypothetical protein JJV70_10260 [Streptomyces sp. JJ66]|uniref:hypothetical protein n=1 Tax=Streptomyces sp. JJ66 TaxID=2803843 RepID=UPI001C58261C|nr:hypothetical protein [Streptomyces sp. JJ66]MBW1602486.1 hypothetical protein [Streptomyces sp. JJ66]